MTKYIKPPVKLSANWRIATDNRQWHVQKRKRTKKGDTWKSLSFIASDKGILLRCLREDGAVIDKRGQARLNKMPETYFQWIAS